MLLYEIDPERFLSLTPESLRIRALARKQGGEELERLVYEIEASFQEEWGRMKAREWTEEDSEAVYRLYLIIKAVVERLRGKGLQ